MQPTSHQLTSAEKKAAAALALIFSSRMLGLFMLLPVFAIYGTELAGFSPLWIGLAIGAYGFTQALLQIPMGWLSDKIGRHQVMLLGLGLFALGSVVAALADSVYMVTFGRVLQGAGAIAGAVLALAADLTREEQRPKVMAIIGMSIGLSFAAAMVLGPMIAARAGLSGVFWFTAAMALLAMGLVLRTPKAIHQAPQRETLAVPALLGKLLRSPQLLRLNLGIMLLHFLLTALFIALPQQLLALDFGSDAHWHLYLPVLFGSFVLMVPMIIISVRKQQEIAFFRLALVLLFSATLLFWLGAAQLPLLAAALLLFFTGFNYLEASLPALLSRQAPAGQKGTAMGLYSSAQFFGAFLGGLAGGLVASKFGLPAVFLLSTLLTIGWLASTVGMSVPAKAERLSIDLSNKTSREAEALLLQLTGLPGVLEATLVPEEQRCYLKVQAGSFDYQQLQSLQAS
ncbi:Predicted arabinose efflux permease, MFS family [Alkalimonas amylolytica]|uniref:Predicted arabinose efflux permease, MFS family n=2 Tax=Alkalimonas amylolytica TaxID=152573 RepID=A0A1H4DF08_ALKAM|nr:Predicted arabinose efflux permease, MFS family [Alkalimonas amylolytica]